MQIEPENIENILVVRNDRFGEFLLNIPALRALRETFPYAKIIAVVNPYVRGLAECTPFIDEIIEWGMQRRSLLERFGLVRLLKARAIDMAVMLNPSKEFNVITYMSGIPIRVGYDRKWGFLLTHKIQDTKHLGQRHEVEHNLELVGLIGAKTEDTGLSLNIEESQVSASLIWDCDLKNADILVALHPWTSDPIKQWPLKKFCELARRLLNKPNVRVVIVGGRQELIKSRELFKGFDNRLINITGNTTLKQLAAILKKCRLLISGDSGPMHLGCAVGVPVIAIFRNDIPGKSARRWGPWGEGHIIIEKSNLYDITVDEVFNRAVEALAK